MHSTNKRQLRTVIAALLLGLMAGSAMADPLVVRSAGPSARSYPPGKALAPTAKIVLKANDMLVILDGRGTRTLKGPGTFSPVETSTAEAADSRTTLAALVNQRSDRRARIGAVRSVSAVDPTSDRSPNVWFVDIERSSTVCVPDPAAVTMWRAGADQATLTITQISDGQSATVDWSAGQSRKSWPATIPVVDGGRYKLNWGSSAQPTQLKFSVLGPNPQGLEEMASTLIQKGCEAQLDLLIETVAVPDKSGQPKG